MARSTTTSTAGFTLIEVLLALALTGLVMSLASAALQGLGRGSERSEAVAARVEILSRGFAALRRDLQRVERAVRTSGSGDKLAVSLAFSGTARALSFVRIEPDYPTEPGSYLIAYRIRSDRTGHSQLVRTRERFDPVARGARGATPESDDVVVIEGRYDLTFSYLEAEAQGRATWRTSWSDPAALPAMVRLTLSPTDPTAPAIPALLVRPLLTRQSECLGARKDVCLETPAEAPPKAETKARAL